MALTLLGASDGQVSYPVSLGGVGVTEMTFAVTVQLASPYAGASRFLSKWSASAATQSFVLLRSSNEVELIVANAEAFSPKLGRVTTDSPLSAGSLVRIMATAKVGISPNIRIWVNGVESTTSSVINNPMTFILDSALDLQVGRETAESEDGVDGQYSEVAVWNEIVPDWVAVAYGQGMSPAFYHGTAGRFYAPLFNTNDFNDRWSGAVGTNTAGANAVQPRMYRPT